MKDTDKQQVIFTNHVGEAIDAYIADTDCHGVFILVDSNTAEAVLPRLQLLSRTVAEARIIKVTPGEDHKNLETVSSIWEQLSRHGATRNSILINAGGGVVTDIGGFVASTFKREIGRAHV